VKTAEYDIGYRANINAISLDKNHYYIRTDS